MTNILNSRTFWINIVGAAYVLLTGEVSNLEMMHMNDHLSVVIMMVINALNVYDKEKKQPHSNGNH